MKYILEVAIVSAIILTAISYALGDEPINMDKIRQIESSGNPLAYNRKSEARGLFQITPIVLKEWNNFHSKERYSENDLFDGGINAKIATWYMQVRIPQYFRAYKIEATSRNYLIAYHDGIGNLRKYLAGRRSLGKEMKGYLVRYER